MGQCSVYEVIVCNLCGSTEFSPVYQLKDFSILRCDRCSLVFKSPLPSDEGVESVCVEAPSSYYEKYYREFRNKSFSRIMETLLGFVRAGRVLDIGCGRGWFLEIAVENGFQPYGIELSEEQVSHARAKFGTNISVGKFEEANYQASFFDVITLLDVLEHFRDPKQMLQKAHSLLKEGGFLAVRVPTTDGVLPRTVDLLYRLTRGKYDKPIKLLYRFHLYGFSQRTLEEYLEQSSFAIAYTYREDSKNLKSLGLKKWARNPLIRVSVKAIVSLARLLNMSDELVVFARKKSNR